MTFWDRCSFGSDPGDIVFVEAALAVPDTTIVTGDLAHYLPEILRRAQVLTPAQEAAGSAPRNG